jgi:hypothetical protein
MYFTLMRCWLSNGKVLKRFPALRAEGNRLMEDGRVDVPEFHPKCILNLKLQGLGQLITAVYETSFTKWRFWKIQLSANKHFPACLSLVEGGTTFSGDEYATAIENPLQESDERFADFKMQHFQAVYRPPS